MGISYDFAGTNDLVLLCVICFSRKHLFHQMHHYIFVYFKWSLSYGFIFFISVTWLVVWCHSLTCSCNPWICSENASTSSILFSRSTKSINPLGLFPYTIWNGFSRVDWLTELLNANSTCGNIESHCPRVFHARHINKFPKLLFTTQFTH